MFEEELVKILEKAEVSAEEDKVEIPPNPKFGDLAYPFFHLAKEQQQSPNEIAQEVAEKITIPDKSPFNRAVATGGYINFFIDWENIGIDILKKILKDGAKYGKPEKKKGKKKAKTKRSKKNKIMVEFAHPNTHKSFHIGHLRTACLGESLCRILEKTGEKVVRSNYQGDVGPHVAKCLWGFINLYNNTVPKEWEDKKGEWLGRVYAEANKKISEDKTAEEQMRDINKKIYAQDKSVKKIWKMTREWSLEDFDKIYKELGTHFNKLYLESAVEKRAIEIAKKLEKNGVAKESEGAIIIDLTDQNLGIFVLLTKEGLPLYESKDLALAEMQFGDFPIRQCIHVVGSEQTFYFKQLFKVFEIVKSPSAGNSIHLVYELVSLKDGKMSSRLGTLVLYTELRDKMLEKVRKEVEKRNPDLEKSEKERISMAIAIAAIKYGIIGTSPEKRILFDWELALQLEGNTGPYLQYAHTRCHSILEKAKESNLTPDLGELEGVELDRLNKNERELMKKLVRFPDEVAQAAKDLRPHYICNYAFDLATAFSAFYQECPVIKAGTGNQRQFRLALVAATKQVLANALGLIGIEALEKM